MSGEQLQFPGPARDWGKVTAGVIIRQDAAGFFVPGQPVGKGRPRIGRAGPHARMYTPDKTASYENLVRTMAHQSVCGREPIAGAVSVRLDLRCAVPASWSGKKQRAALRCEIVPTTKPDTDNVVKAVFDAINGVVWRDDVQVVDLVVTKRYSAMPGVWVLVLPHDSRALSVLAAWSWEAQIALQEPIRLPAADLEMAR